VNQLFNWSDFYNALCQHGPNLLVGIDEDLREVIKELSPTTDMFWSEVPEASLADGSASDDLQKGVWVALDDWRFNVINQLASSFGISLDWEQVSVDDDSPIVDRKVVPGFCTTPVHLNNEMKLY